VWRQFGEAPPQQQLVRGLVEEHEVTASGDILYLRGVILAPPQAVPSGSRLQVFLRKFFV